MKMFIIRLESGEYLKDVELTSTYIDFKRTRDPGEAYPLNDFDAQLVLSRLAKGGHRNASRHETSGQ